MSPAVSTKPCSKTTTAWLYSGFFRWQIYTHPGVARVCEDARNYARGGSLLKLWQSSSAWGSRCWRMLYRIPTSAWFDDFDCPATLEHIPKSALVAATHLLIPLMPDAKAVDGTRVLLDWYAASIQELQLILRHSWHNVRWSRASTAVPSDPAGYQARGYHRP
jgi:chromosome partitioning protein